ncbi:MAG TPA: molybdate ABC transporter substrate-binding protein [Candidatus Acidoferrum sp.]
MFRRTKSKRNPITATGAVILAHLFLSSVLPAQQLRVAAAADLQFAMKDLATKYEARTKQAVEIVYGSSGNFFTQIENGATFDLFFSADTSYPTKLIEQGFADKPSFYRYALGRLTIWASADVHLNVAEQGFQSLLDPRVHKIAIANPEHAPYGRAAVSALQKAGIYEQIKSKLVYGENISQTAQFAQSGNAQVGLVALSLATSPSMQTGDRWVVPIEYHSPLEQAAVVVTSSKNKKAASEFLDFVKSSEGREILAHYGFTLSSDSGGKNP